MKLEAQNLCERDGIDFNHVFRYQFAASKQNLDGFMSPPFPLGGWKIYFGSGLPLVNIKDKSGKVVGVVAGICFSDHVHADSVTLDFLGGSGQGQVEAFSQWVVALGGRYTVFVTIQGKVLVYTDPVGMNGLVYNRADQIVGSSPLVCVTDELQWNDHYNKDDVLSGVSKITLFETSDVRVRRCNPNCYLDLDKFTETRFWPLVPIEPCSQGDIRSILEGIYERANASVAGIVDQHDCLVPVSGGMDSRLMIAMAGSSVGKVKQFFTHIFNYASRIDATIAGNICKRLQLPFVTYDKRNIELDEAWVEEQRKIVAITTGFSAPLPRETQYGLTKSLPEDHVILRGHQTDIMRAVFLDRIQDKARTNFRWQVKRLLIVPFKKFTDEIFLKFLPQYEEWYESLPAVNEPHSIDLMFLEIYYASTIGVTFPALHHNFYMSPFNSREFIAEAMKLPKEYRKNGHAVFDFLMIQNPTLAEVPFDFEFGGKRELDDIDDILQMREMVKQRIDDTLQRGIA